MTARLFPLLLAALCAVPAQAAMHGLERISIAGSDYVRVADWAEEDGLTLHWHKSQETLEITNATANVRLETGSRYARKAEIGGVPVWLSLPVVQRGGIPWVSLVDVQTTLQPLLAPKKSRARVQTICLDPGHGGKDAGEHSGDNLEKKYNLLLARAVEKALQAAGFKVVLTRESDVFVDLAERPAMAARAGADLFVSLHYNSDAHSVRGVEVHCLPPAGMKSSNSGGGAASEPAYPGNAEDSRNVLLAYDVLKSIAALPMEIIGVKREHYKVLKEAHMPAILVEGGFMTDESDAKKIYDDGFRQRMAKSIVNGILAYKKTVEETIPPTTAANAPTRVPGN